MDIESLRLYVAELDELVTKLDDITYEVSNVFVSLAELARDEPAPVEDESDVFDMVINEDNSTNQLEWLVKNDEEFVGLLKSDPKAAVRLISNPDLLNVIYTVKKYQTLGRKTQGVTVDITIDPGA